MLCLALLVSLPRTSEAQKRPTTATRLVSQFADQLEAPIHTLGVEGHSLAWAFRYEASGAGPKDRLDQVIHDLVQGRLGWHKLEHLSELSVTDGATRADLRGAARAARADRLLVVEASVRDHHVHLVGELFDVRLTFWARVRRPIAGMRAHFYARVRLDAELRALMDARIRRPARRFELKPAPDKLPGGALAAGVGDVDGDGFHEIAIIDGHRLRLFRWVGDVVEVATRDLTSLPRAERRSRDRFGSVALVDLDADGRQEVAIWTSDLALGAIFQWRDGALQPLRISTPGAACGGASRAAGSAVVLCGPPLAALPLIGPTAAGGAQLLVGSVAEGRNHLRGQLMSFTAEHSTEYSPEADLFWTLTAHALKLPTPGEYTDLIAVVDRRGRVVIRGGGQSWTALHAGTAAVLLDFDDDGVAELVTSNDGWPGSRDRLSVRRLERGGNVKTVWHKALPAIRDLASGDVDNDGSPDVLVLAGRHVRVLMRAAP